MAPAEWDEYDSEKHGSQSKEEIREAIKEAKDRHFIHKEVRLHYDTDFVNGQLKIDDKPAGEREAGYRINEFEYGEYFCCTCGQRFWDKESAENHLIDVEQSD